MILDLPDLKLQGDDLLQAYSSRGTQHGSDWDKHALFGGKLLDLAIINHWLSKTDPPLSAGEAAEKLNNFLDEDHDDLLSRCIEKYELNTKLVRLSSESGESTVVGLQECKDFLCINVAKLWNNGGMVDVQGWVSTLIEPGSIPPAIPQAAGTSAGIALPSLNGLSVPLGSTSHMAGTTANQNNPLSFVTLQVFNEHAGQKKKHNVSWNTLSSGNAHCLKWRAECYLDGQLHGVGQGSSKKSAQEIAAREVWKEMGWSSTPSDPSSVPQSPVSPSVPSFAQSLDSSLPPAYSSDDAGPEWLTLAIFHHTVNQHKLSIGWSQKQSGDPHLPTWRLTCILNGQNMGSGEANSIKDAKLLAARKAWKNMGWSMAGPT